MRQQLTGRARNTPWVLIHLGRLRPWTLAMVLASVTGLIISIGHTVPNLHDDPTVPPTRTPLLVAALLASTLVLVVRPVLPEPERLACLSMRTARAVVAGAVVCLGIVTLALGSALIAPHPVVRCLGTAAALVGIALCLAPVGTFAALSVPWLYVISGLAFGYQSSVGGPASLHPWAWLVDPETAPLAWELATLAVGLLSFVMIAPRVDRE